MNYCVYCHRNKQNNKVYIGLTSREPEVRWGKNGAGYKSSPHFYAAIQQYGWDNFEHIIIANNLTKAEASKLEFELINQYQSLNPAYGYNLREGGLNGFTPSSSCIEKTMERAKTRTGTTGRKVRCKETGDVFQSCAEAERWSGSSKIAQCCIGERQHAGKHPVTQEQLSWEYAEENAIVTIHCPERLTPVAPFQRSIMCVNTGEIFNSVKDAQHWCGLKDGANIYRCAKGERKSAGQHPQTKEKLIWKYIN